MANQILCIRKSSRMDHYDRITHIGGLNEQGQRWFLTQAEAIMGIENGKWQFHIRFGGRDIPIVVAVSSDGHKYLKTPADRLHPNNLLTLPECTR